MSDLALPKSKTFCSPSADLILRSTDGTDFHVHKVILAMFDLPQPSICLGDASPEPPVVQMSETSKTLDVLLQLLYPDKHPEDIDLSTLGNAVKAADKYDMRGVMAQLKQLLMLPKYIEDMPFRVFALAFQYKLGDDLVQKAARATLRFPAPHTATRLSVPTEIEGLSALAYHSLLVYRQEYVNSLQSRFQEYSSSSTEAPIWCTCTCRPTWFSSHVEATLAAYARRVEIDVIQDLDLLAITLARIPKLVGGCRCQERGPSDLIKCLDQMAFYTGITMFEVCIDYDYTSLSVQIWLNSLSSSSSLWRFARYLRFSGRLVFMICLGEIIAQSTGTRSGEYKYLLESALQGETTTPVILRVSSGALGPFALTYHTGSHFFAPTCSSKLSRNFLLHIIKVGVSKHISSLR